MAISKVNLPRVPNVGDCNLRCCCCLTLLQPPVGWDLVDSESEPLPSYRCISSVVWGWLFHPWQALKWIYHQEFHKVWNSLWDTEIYFEGNGYGAIKSAVSVPPSGTLSTFSCSLFLILSSRVSTISVLVAPHICFFPYPLSPSSSRIYFVVPITYPYL